MKRTFLDQLQRHLANISVGASTARGMGPPGTIARVRGGLQALDLRAMRALSARAYERKLERATRKLVRALPRGARRWGSARKFLNIFMRNVVYSRHLALRYKLSRLEPWLEVPLDSHVARGLRAERGGASLPRWKTVIGLTPELSRLYQEFALKIAKREKTQRIHLDLRYWRGDHLRKN